CLVESVNIRPVIPGFQTPEERMEWLLRDRNGVRLRIWRVSRLQKQEGAACARRFSSAAVARRHVNPREAVFAGGLERLSDSGERPFFIREFPINAGEFQPLKMWLKKLRSGTCDPEALKKRQAVAETAIPQGNGLTGFECLPVPAPAFHERDSSRVMPKRSRRLRSVARVIPSSLAART